MTGEERRVAESVSVTATARLHLGFLDLNGGLGRRFGSLGLALDGPVTQIVVRRAASDSVAGPDGSRAARALAAMSARLGLPGGHHVEIAQAIPSHAGLGSGTQLALAVAAALRALHGMPQDVRADAALLDRGARSGIGVALFEHGGFAMDGGRGDATEVPPLLARLALPETWRILLLLDPAARGLSGDPEHAAFAALPPMPESDSAVICRLALMQALPALAEADLPRFGAAITEIQARVGDHFATIQGGRFTSSRVARALAALRRLASPGIGQSSWGPTGFAFARDAAEACRLRAALERDGAAEGLDMRIQLPLNRGARIGEEP